MSTLDDLHEAWIEPPVELCSDCRYWAAAIGDLCEACAEGRYATEKW